MEDIRIILKLKCWVMNFLQFSQMNWIYWFNIPSKGPIMIVDIPPLKFEVSGITRLLRNINAKKARGADNISLPGFWKKLRLSLPHFSSIFLLYQYKTGQVPSDWVTANDTPVFKKRNRASQVITDRFLWKSNFSKKFLQLENSPPTPHPPNP